MPNPSRKPGLPPLDWLRIFESAARLGGFSAAAREFGLTQAAVSQRIRNLETWLGRDLFLRSARGVSLTYAGEAYLPLVEDALQALELGTENLFGQAPREFRIAGVGSHLNALVLPVAPAFLNAHPDLRLSTTSVPQRSDFAREKTTLHLRFGRGVWPGRDAALICRETLVPVCAPAHGSTPLAEMPLIETRGERPGWRDWAKQVNVTLSPVARLSVDSMEHGLTAAAHGAGLLLGSRPLARPLLDAGQLVARTAPALDTDLGYWLSWPETTFRSSRARARLDAFIDLLRGGT